MQLPYEIEQVIQELKTDFKDIKNCEIGGNGYLFFARNKVTQKEVAIKFYYSEEGERSHEEPRQLASISNPNVLEIEDARTVSDEWAYFITKMCKEGNLDDLILESPSAHTAIDTVLAICHGVSAIHEQGMVHRDLKPANIVLDKGVPKIADFGSVRSLDEEGKVIGFSKHTILYTPPESFDTNCYTKAGDIYQLGLIMFQLLGGSLSYNPFRYFKRSELKEYKKLTNDPDRSIFINGVIQERAQKGKLVNFSTLPPWITILARKNLRMLLNTSYDERVQTISRAVSLITQIRKSINDWRWKQDEAYLTKHGKIYKIRPIDQRNYEALQKKSANYRKVPGIGVGTLTQIVKQIESQ
jgi:serine/threonine protein kinase